jgi:hypothetical protein
MPTQHTYLGHVVRSLLDTVNGKNVRTYTCLNCGVFIGTSDEPFRDVANCTQQPR